jgi:GT2 family glycosyltransferase
VNNAPHTQAKKPAASISVIVVSYHTGDVLFDAINRILQQPCDVELVLVNNGNSAEVNTQLQLMAAATPHMIIIDNPHNMGFAKACNQGAAAASGDIYVMLNPDCLLTTSSLPRLLEVTSTLPDHWLLGPDLRNLDNSQQRGARRDRLTPWLAFIEMTHLDYIAPRHPYFKRMNHDHDAPTDTIEVPAISGAFMAMLGGDFHQIQGFDQHYFLHVEDLDFCYRWHKMGWPIYFTPHLRLTHIQGTSRATHWFIEWHKAQGLVRYFHSHFHLYYPAPFMWLLDAAVYTRFVIQSLRLTLRSLLPRSKSIAVIQRD